MKIYKNYLLENGVNKDQIVIVELDDEINDELLIKGNLRKYIEGKAILNLNGLKMKN